MAADSRIFQSVFLCILEHHGRKQDKKINKSGQRENRRRMTEDVSGVTVSAKSKLSYAHESPWQEKDMSDRRRNIQIVFR